MKKKIISILIIISSIIIFLVFWYRDIIFNIPEIKELKNREELYNTYTDYNLYIEDASDSLQILIELQDIKFQHAFGNLDNKIKSSDDWLSINNNDLYLNVIRGENHKVFNLTDDFISKRVKAYITDVYGHDILDSTFDLYEKVLSITPDDLSLLGMSRNELVANFCFLRLKAGFPPNPIMKFQTEKIHGFQNGLASEDSLLTIDIFDRNNKSKRYCHLVINGPATQEEIGVILNTFEFVN